MEAAPRRSKTASSEKRRRLCLALVLAAGAPNIEQMDRLENHRGAEMLRPSSIPCGDHRKSGLAVPYCLRPPGGHRFEAGERVHL
jgi:hypothetical protein